MFEDPQQRIARHLYGGLLVLAPVGTGKTYALTERVACALEAGFTPARVLCLTFTNRAANEVRDRLSQRLRQELSQLTVTTFHGLCADILRSQARAVDLPSDFTICDEADSIEVLQEVGVREAGAARALYYQIGRLKSQARGLDLDWPPRVEPLFEPLRGQRTFAERYQRELLVQNMLDFGDLVLFVRSIFAKWPDLRLRWEQRFDLVQVDELQDTHESEYRVVRLLAQRSRNLALFGDVDQTIYEWRGSDPSTIIRQFKRDFAPVTTLSLELNRRATRRLIDIASSFARSFERQTRNQAAEDCFEGELASYHQAADERAEARWIGQQIQKLAADVVDYPYSRIGVLTGVNPRAITISTGLAELGVPHVTVEEFDFFRRQEVRDALACLRLVLNPHSVAAMRRLVVRLVEGVSHGTLSRIGKAGEPIGLHLTDLLSAETYATGDPFGRLVHDGRERSLIVFDTETTGLTTSQDEVVEIAAVRLERGQPTDRFHAFLKNSVPLGDSIRFHRLTDDFLARNGRPPVDVIAEFLQFCGDNLLVGHNVSFDLDVLATQAGRLGLELPEFQTADTFALARRFIQADSHALQALAEQFSLRNRPSHRAEADALATADLLVKVLLPRVEARAADRLALVDREAAPFAEFAERLDHWRRLARIARPASLLSLLLDESGLNEHYAAEPRRLGHLAELVELFEANDSTSLDSFNALRNLVKYATLARNVDHLRDGDERVRIITIHQSKGLEFDAVFIAGLFDGELPRRRSVDEGRLEEERRLFYVALTRARRRLYLSHSNLSRFGKTTRPSQFLDWIDPTLLQRV